MTVLYISVSLAAMPPYFFSAEISEYPSVVSGSLVKEFLSFDNLSPDVSYKNDKALTKDDRAWVLANRNIETVPLKIQVKFGYTKYSVNMKMLPSDDTFHKGNVDFDSNQYTRLGASSPLAVLHKSKDSKFYYVQADCMRGWVSAESVEIYDEKNFRELSSLPFLRILSDSVMIGGIRYNIGDKVPVKRVSPNTYYVALPDKRSVYLKKRGEYSLGDANYAEKVIKNLAESLIGNPYDWGGKRGFRDCSSFVRDLWLAFGVDLPRNTSLQSQVGKVLIEKPNDKDEFYDTLNHAEAFKTLIFFKGHVLLFGGVDNGDYVVYHAVNRLAHDNGTMEDIAAIVKQNLIADGFTDIWKRVIKVVTIL